MVSKSKGKKVLPQAQAVPAKRVFEDFTADVDDEELSLTIETLEALSQSPALLRNKRFKPLKAAVHNFVRASASATNGTLTNRISEALIDARWLDAQVLLAEFRLRREEVKLGTLQRWVREVDAAAASGLDVSISAEVFRTLDAILRATAPTEATTKTEGARKGGSTTESTNGTTKDGLREGEESGVVSFSAPVSFSEPSGISLYAQVLDGSIFEDKDASEYKQNAKVIEVISAAERKPPNQYDAVIYTTINPILSAEPQKIVARQDVPGVPGAFVIQDLLSVDECRAIIRQGEAVSFSPDCAVAGTATQQASILAHNFYYYADAHTLNQIYSRALPFLPASIEGCAVKGINARFRVYRYVPGAVYRPHIDGSWPRSGLDLSKPEGSQYMYDDDREGAQLSRLTFLIYLNDDFTAGYTTFFIPDAEPQKLNGIRVEPRLGSALVFPHGESIGALLHEGSAVNQGAKYVIRTEVCCDDSTI